MTALSVWINPGNIHVEQRRMFAAVSVCVVPHVVLTLPPPPPPMLFARLKFYFSQPPFFCISVFCPHVDVELTSVVELFSGRFSFSIKSGM